MGSELGSEMFEMRFFSLPISHFLTHLSPLTTSPPTSNWLLCPYLTSGVYKDGRRKWNTRKKKIYQSVTVPTSLVQERGSAVIVFSIIGRTKNFRHVSFHQKLRRLTIGRLEDLLSVILND